MKLSQATPEQQATITDLRDLNSWAKSQGLTMTNSNISELRALRNTGMRTTNSRRPIK